MGWFSPNGCGCGCGCPVECGDGTTQNINQVTIAILDLDTTVELWTSVSSGVSKYHLHKLVLDLSGFNGSYVFTKDASCTYPADPVHDATVSLAYDYTLYDAVEETDCPNTINSTSSGTTNVRFRIFIDDASFRYVIDFGCRAESIDFSNELFAPAVKPGPCDTADLEMDTNWYTPAGAVSCGMGSIYNATATPA